MTTEQEKFWAGEFGDQYTKRNQGEQLLASNIALFSKILQRTEGVTSVLEFGANTGLNLRAIKALLPSAYIIGVEINRTALTELTEACDKAYCGSVLEFQGRADFVLSKGLLIHVAPEDLPLAYDVLYNSSNDYICIAEYYNPVPVEIEYRGHRNKLFKRDFARELMAKYSLDLIDYGFAYHADRNFMQDDLHWFLMRRRYRAS